jgi:outer membrane protein TolC
MEVMKMTDSISAVINSAVASGTTTSSTDSTSSGLTDEIKSELKQYGIDSSDISNISEAEAAIAAAKAQLAAEKAKMEIKDSSVVSNTAQNYLNTESSASLE